MLFRSECIVKEAGRPIPEIFATDGEATFRDLESRVIASLCHQNGLVIATGGGAILREENSRRLKQNGRLYFLDRPVEQLTPTADRPTAASKEAILRRFSERYPIYTAAADCRIPAEGSVEETLARLERSLSL